MRALLSLMRENDAILENAAASFAQILEQARRHLKILGPEVGEEELIQAVAAALAKLRC